MRSGRLLVTFMILPASQQGAALTDWIAFTPEGYYTGSAGAARFIRWRVGDTLFSAETYRASIPPSRPGAEDTAKRTLSVNYDPVARAERRLRGIESTPL